MSGKYKPIWVLPDTKSLFDTLHNIYKVIYKKDHLNNKNRKDATQEDFIEYLLGLFKDTHIADIREQLNLSEPSEED